MIATESPNPNPEDRAREVRQRLNLISIPVPVEKIAMALGAKIVRSPLDDELSGMIYIKDNIPIIGVNSTHHPHRQRFTIAHEIAHLEMHRSFIEGKVHVDKKFRVLRRDSKSATGTIDIEVAANQFAAELLIPEKALLEQFGDSIIDIDEDGPIDQLARHFKVSKKAMEHRIQRVINRLSS